MNRRTFFGMLGAVTAAVTGLVKAKPMSRMDEINREALQILHTKLNAGMGDSDGYRAFPPVFIDTPHGTLEWTVLQNPDHW